MQNIKIKYEILYILHEKMAEKMQMDRIMSVYDKMA